ncbi:MAG: hypothetical protein JOZ78_05525 [Chroococcidiopsidaceae cyanobacterium CP_BM_ER_R8_30]|nr:hypothetical protein [Chroococcidiopsidaceae cyanobacterium CP_BM_ER_R8_30]
MLVLFGTAAACLFLAASSLLKWHQPGAAYLLIGSLLYLVGTILVTEKMALKPCPSRATLYL